ncbi:hypothetical protein BC936DRAFT_139916 [Jimgerdemannia flammicorona]|uniref:Uncharacterized protein n=1 Tax=Jimgerdemannia flammicorona TaxID=994334 RepID=A0A433B955_9FUNG|nr:hypothetical protein BC936DRAFT_139916 [Jimgerdemannia flammicorona]
MKESAVNLSDHPEHYSRLHWQQLCHPTLLSPTEQFLTSFISSPAVPSPQISILTTWDTAPHLYPPIFHDIRNCAIHSHLIHHDCRYHPRFLLRILLGLQSVLCYLRVTVGSGRICSAVFAEEQADNLGLSNNVKQFRMIYMIGAYGLREELIRFLHIPMVPFDCSTLVISQPSPAFHPTYFSLQLLSLAFDHRNEMFRVSGPGSPGL